MLQKITQGTKPHRKRWRIELHGTLPGTSVKRKSGSLRCKEQCRELRYSERNREPCYREQGFFDCSTSDDAFGRSCLRVKNLKQNIDRCSFCTLVKIRVFIMFEIIAGLIDMCPCCLWNTDFSAVVVCLLQVVALDRFGNGRCFLLADLALILTTICLVWCFTVERNTYVCLCK